MRCESVIEWRIEFESFRFLSNCFYELFKSRKLMSLFNIIIYYTTKSERCWNLSFNASRSSSDTQFATYRGTYIRIYACKIYQRDIKK